MFFSSVRRKSKSHNILSGWLGTNVQGAEIEDDEDQAAPEGQKTNFNKL